MAYTISLTRGIRNKNPFNIRKSNNSWRGKTALNPDKEFERFTSMDYGLRAGFLLLRNAYLAKGFNTVEKIINRYAPSSENNTDAYIKYIYEHSSHLFPGQTLNVTGLAFYELCMCICKYESDYDLSYEHFRQVCNKFGLGF